MTPHPVIPGVVVVRSKVYEGMLPPTAWAEQRCSIERAAALFGRWSQLYMPDPDPANTECGVVYWFRDAHDINMLVKVIGATIDELRAAWRGREA